MSVRLSLLNFRLYSWQIFLVPVAAPSYQTFTVTSPIIVTLAFTALPSKFTIFTISAFVHQTTYIRSSRVLNMTARMIGPERITAHQGSKRGFAEEGFAKRTRAEGGGPSCWTLRRPWWRGDRGRGVDCLG
jgi:hypothetical protein